MIKLIMYLHTTQSVRSILGNKKHSDWITYYVQVFATFAYFKS